MWFSYKGQAKKTRAGHRRRTTQRPRLETLEDRCLLSGGTLDPTFGAGGLVTGPSGKAYSVAIQADAKIVVVGTVSNEFEVVRRNPDGSLDSTFGSGGIVVTQTGKSGSQAWAVAIQGDGKIVAVGESWNPTNDYAISMVRYNSDGTLDTSFGKQGNGIVTANLTPRVDYATGVVLQSDGKIVVVGVSNMGAGNNELAALRYNTDGSLDATFGRRGIVQLRQGVVVGSGSSVVLQGDGKIVVSGDPGGTPAVAVVRLTASGQLDSTFGSGGVATTTVPGAIQTLSPVVALENGNIVAVGPWSTDYHNKHLYLTRFTSAGQLDTSFGSAGMVTNNAFAGTAVLVAGNGDLLAAGTTTKNTPTGTYDFALAAFLPTGALDTTFGTNGITTTDFNHSTDSVTGMVLQSDGNIVLAGNKYVGGNSFALARYLGSSGPAAPQFAISVGPARRVPRGPAAPSARWVIGVDWSLSPSLPPRSGNQGHALSFSKAHRQSPRAGLVDRVFADIGDNVL